jgi:hypothetical protein
MFSNIQKQQDEPSIILSNLKDAIISSSQQNKKQEEIIIQKDTFNEK